MRLYSDQMELIANSKFIEKLDLTFCRDVSGFSDIAEQDRHEFLIGCLFLAKRNGLLTEQGIASYALGAWWLGESFEEKSRYVHALFASNFPEVRKVYAMNEWVSAVLGAPENMTSADERLKRAFYRTSDWESN